MNISNEFKVIKFEVEGSVAIVTINRPDKLNALNRDVLSELKELFDDLTKQNNYSIRGIIFTGEGEKSFVAGADISEMADMNSEEAHKMGKLGQCVTTLIENLPIPVIAAVNGFALGGGCELAMSADFIICSKSAIFGQPEVKLGLIPGFGGTQRLAKLVGRNVAKEIIYTGRNMTSEEALSKGLVLSIHDDKTSLMEAAKKIISKISRNSPVAVGIAKISINSGIDLTVTEGLSIELDNFSKLFETEDMREGTKAFLEKRSPVFVGK